MVAMMDGTSAWWAFRWLLSGDTPGATSRLVLGGDILAHLGLQLDHVGFLWNSTRINHAGNYDLHVLPPKEQHFTDDEVARLVTHAAQTQELRADWPQDVPTKWMSAFLEGEMLALQRRGVNRFAFYSVPTMQGPTLPMPAASAPQCPNLSALSAKTCSCSPDWSRMRIGMTLTISTVRGVGSIPDGSVSVCSRKKSCRELRLIRIPGVCRRCLYAFSGCFQKDAHGNGC